MTAPADYAWSFAALLCPEVDNVERLEAWIAAVRDEDLPNLHTFARGLDQDGAAVEGANTKTKLIKRQTYGKAGFELLRHRILLGSTH